MDGIEYRFAHFINTISDTHNVVRINNINEIHDYDLAIIDYFSCRSDNPHDEMCTRINSFRDDLMRFNGKFIFYSLDDGQAIYTNELDSDIVSKLDAWIVYMINDEFLKSSPLYDEIIREKLVRIPRYTIPYINTDNVVYENKINKITFIGRTTGNYWFDNKNWRIESLKMIYNNDFLKDNFDGWIVDDEIIDVPHQVDDYNKTFKFVRKNKYLTETEWFSKLKDSTLSLCIPGHTKLGYRHYQSMAFKSTMLATFDLTTDPYPYLFSDKLENISYVVNDDLSNLVEICEDALTNTQKTKEYALNAYDVYKTYFEVTEQNTYKDHVWNIIKDQFSELNIYI